MKKKILIIEDKFPVAHELAPILERAGHEIICVAPSSIEAETIFANMPDMVLLGLDANNLQERLELARLFTKQHVPFICLSAHSDQNILEAINATHPYGFLVKPFREKDLLVALNIAWYRYDYRLKELARSEIALNATLKQILEKQLGSRIQLKRMLSALQHEVSFDFATLMVTKSDGSYSESVYINRAGFNEFEILGSADIIAFSGLQKEGFLAMFRAFPGFEQAGVFNTNDFLSLKTNCQVVSLLSDLFKLQAKVRLPTVLDDGRILALSFYSRVAKGFQTKEFEFLIRSRYLLTNSFKNFLSVFSDFEQKSAGLPANLIDEQSPNIHFEGIMGRSLALRKVFDQVLKVAAVNTSVLIIGENGTGKEKIAKAIHRISPRNQNPLVIVNCATLPPNLIESELFGHERGSFTGANERRIGKFEQAHKSTIFLDEIGELPLALQVKLLRVLQEREIERVGGKGTIKIDVRIIAATNRNLEREVAEGRFRTDLFYRLNVFPIQMPPLRERIEDIPVLTRHFIKLYAEKMKKTEVEISARALDQLLTFHWPGNIRQLENLVERTMVLSAGEKIESFPCISITSELSVGLSDNKVKTIDEVEKEHIMNVLIKSGYKIFGPGGAAELLNMAPTTLSSKIKRFGIELRRA